MFKFFHKEKDGSIVDLVLECKAKELHAMELAIECAVDLIAKTIAKSEFRVVRKVDGKLKKVKDENYYKLNIKPNPNETGFVFWRKVIHKMFHENEALIVITGCGDMFLAESFNVNDAVMTPSVFYNVTIEANDKTMMLNRSFRKDEVLYLRNDNKKIKNLLRLFNQKYSSMIGIALKSYKLSNAQKIKMSMPGNAAIKIDGKILTTNEYVEKIKEMLQSDDTEVIAAHSGVDYNSIFSGSQKNADDFMKLLDKMIEIAGFAFDIPVDVFIGKTTEKSNAQNDFITFSILPVIKIIEDGINACFVSKEEFLDGEMVSISTSKMKHHDMLEVVSSLDKLFAMGFSHNNILEYVGEIPIDEEWANKRYVTKNYGEGGE